MSTTKNFSGTMESFSVIRRNFGHWDICTDTGGRAFRIRGGPGDYRVLDERVKENKKDNVRFKTVSACMGYICDELMYELIVAEGQAPQLIESWNVSS